MCVCANVCARAHIYERESVPDKNLDTSSNSVVFFILINIKTLHVFRQLWAVISLYFSEWFFYSIFFFFAVQTDAHCITVLCRTTSAVPTN